MHWFIFFGLLAGFQRPVFGERQYKYPFLDPTLSWSDRVNDLVGRLTLDEVANQTLAPYANDKQHIPQIPRLGINPYVWITECLRGQVSTNTTAFPQSIGIAASFSKYLIYNMSEAISYEVRAHWNGNRKMGNYVTFNGLSCFSPVINIMRHPLWGRSQETYGEDPYLAGAMARDFVIGLQGLHPRYVRVNAGCKHFDVHGGPENIPVDRSSFDAKVSMRDWRMTFLPAFKMCVDAGTYSLMCSYNSINGIPACANKQLLTDITRKEWGFNGYVVSDAGAISNILYAHKYTTNLVDTATVAIKAGVNLELGSDVFLSQVNAVKQGNLTEQEVRDNIKPLFYTRMRLGEFDPEEMNPYNRIDMSVVQSPYHCELAVRAAMMSFVLLKNYGEFLPLKKKLFRKISVIGPFADDVNEIFGDYGSNMVPEFTTSVYKGLSALGQASATASGCDNTHCNNYDSAKIIEATTGADLIVVCLGTGPSVESEGNDRAYLDLPGYQLQLLKDAVVTGHGAPVILLLFNAGPVDVTWAKYHLSIPVIMECFFPAQSTGTALYQMFTMTGGPLSVPAARLPSTWPADLSEVPPITNYSMAGRTYRYSKSYPLYPFGYGLSYSKFMYSNLQVTPAKVTKGQNVTVTVNVRNMGPYDADEVAQLYMSWPQIPVPVPNIQLVGFERPTIMNSQVQTVTFTITPERLEVWEDDISGFQIPSGVYTLYAGGQQPGQLTAVSSNVLSSTFTVL